MTLFNSPYAPIRLQNEFWWLFAKDAAEHGFVSKDGMIASNLPIKIMDELVTPIMSRSSDLSPEGQGGVLGTALSLRHWIPLASQYELNGKQIFDLDDRLVEMLANTGLGDTTLEHWHPVYDAFYLRFGKQDDLKLEFDSKDINESNYEYFDGAFISVTPDDKGERRIKFGLTTVKDNGSGVMLPGHFLDLNQEEQRQPVIEGINAALIRRETELTADVEDGGNENIVEIMRIKHRDAIDLMKSAAALIVNGLFYLSEYRDDQKKQPGRDTPPSYELKWRISSTKKKKDNLLSKMQSQGYTFVNMCGTSIGNEVRSHTQANIATHWRRGHWRSQPHGEARKERKNIWIKPVVVGMDIEPPQRGHIYQAQTTDTPQ
jgi:hypothetical protein